MSLRILQVTLQWQRFSCITKHVNFQSYSKMCGYAMRRRGRLPQEKLAGIFIGNTEWSQFRVATQSRLASAPKESSFENKSTLTVLLKKLTAYNQNYGQLNMELCEKIVKQLKHGPEKYNSMLSDEESHFLLRACGTQMPAQPITKRLELFQGIWSHLAQHSKLSAPHYFTWLHVLQANRAPLADYRVFLQEFNKLNVGNEISAQELYDELLDTACASGNMQQSIELIAEMRAQNSPLSERHFNALILVNARNNDLAGCRTVIENMMAAGITPSTETQSILVSGYIENESYTQALEVLNQHQRQFNAAQVMRMLRSLLYVKNQPDEEFIVQLVRELPKDFVEGAEVALPLQHLCIELLYSGNLPVVTTIISTLPNSCFNENQDIDTFGVFLLQELFRAKYAATKIIEVADLLQQTGKNTRALHVATEIALRRNTGESMPFLKSLFKQESLRPHYFWPLLVHNYQQSGEVGVLNTLKQMTHFNVTCDRQTITQYVLPNLKWTLRHPEEALKALDDAGIKPSFVLADVIIILTVNQRLDAAHDLLELYPTKLALEQLVPILANAAVNVRATKRYQQYVKLLTALAKKCENQKCDWVGQLLLHMLQGQIRLRNDLKAVNRFLTEMCKFGLKVSPAAMKSILSILEQHGDDVALAPIKEALRKMSDHNVMLMQSVTDAYGTGSSFIKHPRDMSPDELECHLIELEAKGLNTRGVLRRLLQLCVRDGRLERALEVKAKCDELRVHISSGMLASIFDLYIKLQDLPKAEACLKRLQREFPEFPIDEHKFIDYAALLVQEQQLEAAKEMLQARAASQKVHGGDYVLKNVWKFLSNVAQLAAETPTLPPEHNLTRENFHFLQKLRYCNAHNAILGPIVRERLLRGDIKAAVADFKKLAEQYKHTPLQFELLSLLVRLSNANTPEVAKYGNVGVEDAQQLLSDVTDTISKVHGPLNMKSGLLLAVAEAGTEKQLRQLLINPEFRINEELLFKNCEHLGEEGAVTTLLRLARGARGFGRIIDEQSIYIMLLKHFARANNYQSALSLYDQLEADDELKISQEFLHNLVHLLNVNKVEVPSNVALRAQIM